jgi:hypothetical protein
MTGCCNPRGCDGFSTPRIARRAARRDRDKGIDKTARRMVALLERHGIAGATVLEVGGGVGELQIELLKRGAARTVNLELSLAYDEEAARLLRENGVEERAGRHLHDLAADPNGVEPADVVVLHRVVFCYPELRAPSRSRGRTRASSARVQLSAKKRRLAFPDQCAESVLLAASDGVPDFRAPARADARRRRGARTSPHLCASPTRLADSGIRALVPPEAAHSPVDEAVTMPRVRAEARSCRRNDAFSVRRKRVVADPGEVVVIPTAAPHTAMRRMRSVGRLRAGLTGAGPRAARSRPRPSPLRRRALTARPQSRRAEAPTSSE